MSIGIAMAERGLLPDRLTRYGIRRLLHDRLVQEDQGDDQRNSEALRIFVSHLADGPIAIDQDAANDQHYEVPAEFYQLVLGPHLKYSSCYWEADAETLTEAEHAMLKLCCERAGIVDGMRILDIGCGWGSMSLFIAQNYPKCRIEAVSNSHSQRAYINKRCEALNIDRINVHTCDLTTFTPPGTFDRIVSVECLEHMRNYSILFERFASWLNSNGKAFIHVFCHKRFAYPFETVGDDNWMGRHFFTGGLMPSWNLFEHFDNDLRIEQRWQVDGRHYGRTARAWLERLDTCRSEVLSLFSKDLDQRQAYRHMQRWRIFFMACEELFNYNEGKEWLVGHYLMSPNS